MSSSSENASYGLFIGDLVIMNPIDPGHPPGLVLSLPNEEGYIDILIQGEKRTVGWTQVRPVHRLSSEWYQEQK